jgi:hypothetical protein
MKIISLSTIIILGIIMLLITVQYSYIVLKDFEEESGKDFEDEYKMFPGQNKKP